MIHKVGRAHTAKVAFLAIRELTVLKNSFDSPYLEFLLFFVEFQTLLKLRWSIYKQLQRSKHFTPKFH